MLVAPLVSLAQQTTTYGTGSPSGTSYAGGTIQGGDTVILNNGANVTGAIEVSANATLQFNQTTNLTLTNAVSGSGNLNLTNRGNLTLAYNSSGLGTTVATALDLATSLANGTLLIGTGGAANLAMGLLVMDVAPVKQGDQHVHIQEGHTHDSSSRRPLISTRSTGAPWGFQGSRGRPLRWLAVALLSLEGGTGSTNAWRAKPLITAPKLQRC